MQRPAIPFLLAASLAGSLGLACGSATTTPAPGGGQPGLAAPSGLAYSVNPAVYTQGVAITANTPSSSGGAVTSYSVSPALPAGLSLNTSTGFISGTPTAVTATATYTVTAGNSAGTTTVGVVITVNAAVVPPSGLAYSVNPAVYTQGVAITANTPSSSGGAVTSYSVSPALPAGLSLNTSTGVISGTPTAVTATATYTVTAGNSAGTTTVGVVITVNAAVVPPSGLAYSVNPAVYTQGVAITANTPSSSGGAVTSYSVSPALPAGLSLNTSTGVISGTPTAVTATATYTVTAGNSAGTTTVGVVITVNAAVVPPSGLAYSVNPAVYTQGVAITANTPSSSGGAVTSYSVSPALPAGLSLNTSTGVISGTPTAVTATATYTVTAGNSAGTTTVGVVITVNAAVVPPSGLAYSVNPAVYTQGVAITANTPSSSGGAVTSYSVSPALPAGLSLNTSTGVISGTPTAVTATATYTVTAGNSAGTTTVGVVITVLPGGGGQSPVMRLAASTWLNLAYAATMTTPTFSSQGAPRVWVAVVSWYPPFDDPPPTTVRWVGGTPAGQASDWQLVVRSYDGTVHWCSEIWWATSTQQLTNASVIASRSGATSANYVTGILSVYEVSGARTTWGASAEHHSPMSEVSQDIRTNVVEVPITATASNSLIIGISQYGDYYAPSVANALTTIDYQQNDGGGDGGAAAWHKTTGTAASTSYTLGVRLPLPGNTRAFSGCAVEVLAP